MPLLIDTYNVLHTVGVLPPDMAGVDMNGLIALLENSRYRHEKVTLACDGSPGRGDARPQSARGASIAIRYSGRDRSADDLIARLVDDSSAPRRLIVVSSDHQVLRAARRRRCPTFSSQEFLQQLVDDALSNRSPGKSEASKPSSAEMTDEQINRWISVFKLDRQTLDIPSGAPPPASPIEASRAGSPGIDFPADLIEQAEELWRKNRKRT